MKVKHRIKKCPGVFGDYCCTELTVDLHNKYDIFMGYTLNKVKQVILNKKWVGNRTVLPAVYVLRKFYENCAMKVFSACSKDPWQRDWRIFQN